MSDLDRFIPTPRLDQVDHVDIGVPVSSAWQAVRHLDMARSSIVRALFSLRTIPDRLRGRAPESVSLRIDDLAAPGQGFQVLAERPGSSITIGAIGRVWQPQIDFMHVPPDDFAGFEYPGWAKVAWELRFEPRGHEVTRLIVEVRVSATDDASWRRFERYWLVVGPFSHFIRRHLLDLIVSELGTPREAETHQPLAGDTLLLDAAGEATDGVTIAASPDAIWPWLVQMGCQRAGWYSWDALDNGGMTSACRIVAKLQDLHVGDVIPAMPKGDAGFEVLILDAPRAFVLGGLYDVETGRQLAFTAARPAHFWQTTWAFVLEPLDGQTTRLHVRARAALGHERFGDPARLFMAGLVHHFMETAQLRHLKTRVESGEKAEGATGRQIMIL